MSFARDTAAVDTPAERGEGSLIPFARRYWAILRRHLWVTVGIIGVALILALVVTFLMTPHYTAVARVEVSRQADNVTNVERVQRDETSPSQEFYATQYALLDTRSLAERVAKRLNLSRDEHFFEAQGESMNGFFASTATAPDAAEMRERDRKTIDLLLENVTVSPIRGSSLIDLMYTTADPELSAKIANVWVEEFSQQAQDRRFGSTRDARAFLEQRLSDLRQRLEQSERDLVNYAGQENIVRLSESRTDEGRTRTTQTLASTDLEALNGSLADATAARIAAEAQNRAVLRNSASEQSLSNPALNQLRENRAQAQAQYQNLLVQFEPEYPAARALKRQVDSLDAAIATEEGRVKGASRTALEAAQAREASLRGRVDSLKGRLGTENRASIQYNIYQRDVDTNRELYDALLQRYKEIGAAGVGSSNIAIVDEARVPEKPSSPKLALNLALALLLGMATAAAVVTVLENLDEGVRDPEQLREKLGQPVLGVIPYTSDDEDVIQQLSDPKSEIAEAYMTLRTNLGFSTSNGVPRTLAVTSSRPAEGKSTTSLALAQILARSGKKVALMDLDMRRPIIDRLIGGVRDFGMSNYLAGENNLDALFLPTEHENLTYISAGPIPPSAAELLTGDRLANLLSTLAERFDHIVIDSPPVLGLSDAPLIAGAVEGLVFVMQATETSARTALHALDRVNSAKAHVLGAVLTKYRASDTAYGYGYGYSYRYEAGVGERPE